MEYLWVVDGVQENLIDNAANAECTAEIDGGALITDYANYANRVHVLDSGDAANTYDACAGTAAPEPEPTGVNLVLTTDGAAVRLTGPWWGWDPNGGPEASDNGDGTWTVTLDPAPTENMEYLWVVDGVQENLIDNAANAECTAEIDGGSLITDYSGWANRVLVLDSGDAANTYDACAGTAAPEPEEPSIPASPAPADAADSVLSLFSDAYSDLEGTDFNPNWGQSTQVAVTDVITYTGLNYQGTGYASSDVSGYEYFHVDFYTSDATALDMFVIKEGQGVEVAYSLTDQIVLDEWVSVNIPLTAYADVVDLTGASQLKVVGNGTVLLDNLYFGGVAPAPEPEPEPEPVVATTYCSAPVTHFNIADHPGSILLTVENSGADSMTVTASSNEGQLVDALIVEAIQGGGTATAATIVDGVATSEITWAAGTMPATTSFTMLWSDDAQPVTRWLMLETALMV